MSYCRRHHLRFADDDSCPRCPLFQCAECDRPVATAYDICPVHGTCAACCGAQWDEVNGGLKHNEENEQ